MNPADDEYKEEQRLLHALEARNVKAFMQLYKEYRDHLVIFAYSQLNDREKAIQAVEEFFEDLWEAARFKEITPPIYKFLFEQLRGVCERKSAS